MLTWLGSDLVRRVSHCLGSLTNYAKKANKRFSVCKNSWNPCIRHGKFPTFCGESIQLLFFDKNNANSSLLEQIDTVLIFELPLIHTECLNHPLEPPTRRKTSHIIRTPSPLSCTRIICRKARSYSTIDAPWLEIWRYCQWLPRLSLNRLFHSRKSNAIWQHPGAALSAIRTRLESIKSRWKHSIWVSATRKLAKLRWIGTLALAWARCCC